ncbi:hypothetical protein [Agromyces humatus]|uniref:Bacitracin resistance protein n=1 Tax=Agromyces humatus TaxID=279573 RepID=A0ABN2KT60_9MICO|nr:hypothetical protein [Agromyces humatus]
MSAESADVMPSAAESRTPLWLDVALAVLFGLFFAYDVWEVVGSIVQLTGLGLAFSAVGWVLLIAALLAPVASFVAAFALGRRRGVVAKAALYLAGLAVSAALFLTLTVLLNVSGGIVVP